MKYKFTMKQSYHEYEFIFDNYEEGCVFMNQAITHNDGIFFEVEILKEESEAEDEVV